MVGVFLAGGVPADASICGVGERTGDHPMIGLALSGGGARGLAHVGVLKVLEEHEIPIDCIVGTSMGAVVGGMYALGMSPEEIEAEVLAIDWAAMFRGATQREDLSFRRKEDERKFLFGAEIGLTGEGILFPSAPFSSLALDFFLERLVLRARGVTDFDDLQIPFRAVTTDLRSGEVVVLQGGSLSTAIRASMAVPGILTPVEIDNYSLVDGGVLDNLPVQAVRDLGAEVVIAVDVATPLPGDVQSAPSIAAQALSLALEQRNIESRAQADLLIRPELGELAPLDFSQAVAAMPRGEEAARARSEELESLGDALRFARFRRAQRKPAPLLPVLGSVTIEGADRVSEARIRRRVQSEIGEPLLLGQLEADLGRISSIGEFSSVRFELREPLENGDLLFRVEEKDWGPHYLRLGLGFSDDLAGSNSLSARVNYTRTSLNRLGAEWRNEVQTGRTRGLSSELFQPLDSAERWFVAPRVMGRREVRDVYDDRERVAEYDVESWAVGFDLGWELGKYGQFRVGVERGQAQGETRVGDPNLPEIDAETGAAVARFVVDRLDSAGVPRRGYLFDAVWRVSEPSLGAEDEYQKLSTRFQQYRTAGRHTALFGLEGGTSLGTETPAYDPFLVGGLFSLSGYSVGELSGNYYGVARLGYFYRIYDLPVAFGTAVFLGGWMEAGNVWPDADSISSDDLLGALTLAAGIDTRFGPVYVAHGVANDGERQFYLRLGTSF